MGGLNPSWPPSAPVFSARACTTHSFTSDSMSAAFKLANRQTKLFKTNYATGYKTFIPNHVTADHMHPLNETQKRLQKARKKEGLWWHVTTGVDLSKSSCVRSWARRRLRNAVEDELKARGFNENGTWNSHQPTKAETSPLSRPKPSKSTDLTGSLRLHIQAALVPAKYVDIKAEVGSILDAIVVDQTRHFVSLSQVNGPLKQLRKVPAVDPGSRTPALRFTRLQS